MSELGRLCVGFKWIGFKMGLNEQVQNRLDRISINYFINLNIKIPKFHTMKRENDNI